MITNPFVCCVQISPLFKQNFAQVRRLGEKRHALEVLPVPYPVSPWLTAKPEHRPISFRIDDGKSHDCHTIR